MFDKVQYWKNRKAGKRGQGEYPVVSAVNQELSKPAFRRPRGVQRNSKPRYKGVGLLPTQDPSKSNHQRLLERRAAKVSSN